MFHRQSWFDSARYCGAIEAETPASHDHIAGCNSEDHRSTHWSWYVCLHYTRLRELSCPVGHAILNPRSCGDVFQVWCESTQVLREGFEHPFGLLSMRRLLQRGTHSAWLSAHVLQMLSIQGICKEGAKRCQKLSYLQGAPEERGIGNIP